MNETQQDKRRQALLSAVELFLDSLENTRDTEMAVRRTDRAIDALGPTVAWEPDTDDRRPSACSLLDLRKTQKSRHRHQLKLQAMAFATVLEACGIEKEEATYIAGPVGNLGA